MTNERGFSPSAYTVKMALARRVVVTGIGAVSPNGIGREAFWKATQAGLSGVRRITRAYEVRGVVSKLTSYDNATVGSGSIVNEVQLAFNNFAQITHDYQSHSGAVNTSTTRRPS